MRKVYGTRPQPWHSAGEVYLNGNMEGHPARPAPAALPAPAVPAAAPLTAPSAAPTTSVPVPAAADAAGE